jgi:sec-independent protein translocase protein TatC
MSSSASIHDPEHYRMSIGEHLEELRGRLILGLMGFLVGAIIALALGKHVIIPFFTHPLTQAQVRCGLNPQLYYTEPAQPFVVYMEISIICGTVIASPWLLYQLWQFVAAGLYEKERRMVTKYLPLSIVLLFAGEITLYFLVLPVTLEFFFRFGDSLPILGQSAHIDPHPPTTQPFALPIYRGDPPQPRTNGQVWIDADRNRLNSYFNDQTHTIFLGTENLAAPMITLPQYIDMVEGMLVAFGVSFQLPLVIMALVSVGIVELSFLRSMRRYIYFAIAVVAAFIIPDVATGWIMLMVPLFGLYELGIYLGARSLRKKAAAEAAGS